MPVMIMFLAVVLVGLVVLALLVFFWPDDRVCRCHHTWAAHFDGIGCLREGCACARDPR